VRLLELSDGAVVMYAKRIVYIADGVASEYLVAVWRGGRYEFKVSLTHPQ